MTLFGFLEVFPDQPVLSPARASKAIVKTTTTLAHPPYLPGWHTGHQGIILYVFRHNGSGSDQSAPPYRMTAHNRAIRAEGSSLTHARTRVNAVYREVRPRSIYIREYAGRSTEDVILQFPIRTLPATFTFCPREQFAPMTAPLWIWQKCQILVPGPIMAPSST